MWPFTRPKPEPRVSFATLREDLDRRLAVRRAEREKVADAIRAGKAAKRVEELRAARAIFENTSGRIGPRLVENKTRPSHQTKGM